MTSEKTANYGLPHYLPGDHPDFLTEINKAYETIDAALALNADMIEDVRENINVLTERIKALETAIGKE